jgi:hypothetical protein
MVPHSTLDTFHSLLMDDDQFNEAMMRVALKVVQSYMAPGEVMTDADYDLANELCCRVSVA